MSKESSLILLIIMSNFLAKVISENPLLFSDWLIAITLEVELTDFLFVIKAIRYCAGLCNSVTLIK